MPKVNIEFDEANAIRVNDESDNDDNDCSPSEKAISEQSV